LCIGIAIGGVTGFGSTGKIAADFSTGDGVASVAAASFCATTIAGFFSTTGEGGAIDVAPIGGEKIGGETIGEEMIGWGTIGEETTGGETMRWGMLAGETIAGGTLAGETNRSTGFDASSAARRATFSTCA
jgi:hypothetical protein